MESRQRLLFGTAGIPLTSKSQSCLAGIERVHELGLGCMEVEFVHGITLDLNSAAVVADAALAKRIRLTAHAPYYINLNSREPKKVAASRTFITRTAQVTSVLGGDSIVFHPAFYMEDPHPQVYERVKSNLANIVQKLKADGNQVWVRPEVTGKLTQFGTLDEVLCLSSELEGVAPAIDFAHLHARNGGVNSYGEFAAVLKRIEEELGPEALYNLHMHVSGIEYGPRGERRHIPLADSDLKYPELLRACKDLNVGGVLICESPNLEFDAMLMQQTYTRL